MLLSLHGAFKYPGGKSVGNSLDELRRSGAKSIYKPGEFVGKSILRVKRTNGVLTTAPDADIFERWAQALSSASDLYKLGTLARPDGEAIGGMCVVPIVVIPNGTLWVAEYSEQHGILDGLGQKDECSFYVERDYRIDRDGRAALRIEVSHLHFLTLDGFRLFLERTQELLMAMIPDDALEDYLTKNLLHSLP